ncbi:MAG TPA: class I adenylate-forming enzyme family protein [Pseudonocardia sp.]|jgi:acyl-CoA synthetase (AMP-forming)/AMP-acid ligase II
MTSFTALLRASAKRHHDRVCLRDGDTVLTYRQVFDRAGRFAGTLRHLGVRPGDPVMVSMGVSWQSVIVVLGSLLASAAVAPTNPAARRRELMHWGRLVQPVAIVAAPAPMAELLGGDGTGELTRLRGLVTGSDGGGDSDLGTDLATGVSRDPMGAAVDPPPSSPALIMFTSGTTGLSKGVTRNHATLVGFLDHWQRRVVRPDDVVLNFLPLNHQAGLLLSVLGPMCLGAEVALLPRFGVEEFWRSVVDNRVTWTVTMPPVPGLLVAADAPPARGAHRLRGTLGAGPAPAWRDFEDAFDVGMVTGYGSTESTMVTMSGTGRASGALLAPDRGGSFCGAPLPGWTRVRVSRPDGGSAGAGEPGEIQLRGGGLFSEYWNNPEATARAFTEDGWFRSGDLGYRGDGGELYLLGRADDRIRRNGENIDPVEIETVLREHPAVADAGLTGIPDEHRGAEILACVVPRDGAQVSAEELVEFCRGQLSSFKVPRFVQFRTELPKTDGTFRIQRAVLREQADPSRWYDRFAERA